MTEEQIKDAVIQLLDRAEELAGDPDIGSRLLLTAAAVIFRDGDDFMQTAQDIFNTTGQDPVNWEAA